LALIDRFGVQTAVDAERPLRSVSPNVSPSPQPQVRLS
jgi:hypothetical protein